MGTSKSVASLNAADEGRLVGSSETSTARPAILASPSVASLSTVALCSISRGSRRRSSFLRDPGMLPSQISPSANSGSHPLTRGDPSARSVPTRARPVPRTGPARARPDRARRVRTRPRCSWSQSAPASLTPSVRDVGYAGRMRASPTGGHAPAPAGPRSGRRRSSPRSSGSRCGRSAVTSARCRPPASRCRPRPGPSGGIRLIEGWRTELDGLATEEAVALFLGGPPAVVDELGLGPLLDRGPGQGAGLPAPGARGAGHSRSVPLPSRRSWLVPAPRADDASPWWRTRCGPTARVVLATAGARRVPPGRSAGAGAEGRHLVPRRPPSWRTAHLPGVGCRRRPPAPRDFPRPDGLRPGRGVGGDIGRVRPVDAAPRCAGAGQPPRGPPAPSSVPSAAADPAAGGGGTGRREADRVELGVESERWPTPADRPGLRVVEVMEPLGLRRAVAETGEGCAIDTAGSRRRPADRPGW